METRVAKHEHHDSTGVVTNTKFTVEFTDRRWFTLWLKPTWRTARKYQADFDGGHYTTIYFDDLLTAIAFAAKMHDKTPRDTTITTYVSTSGTA